MSEKIEKLFDTMLNNYVSPLEVSYHLRVKASDLILGK